MPETSLKPITQENSLSGGKELTNPPKPSVPTQADTGMQDTTLPSDTRQQWLDSQRPSKPAKVSQGIPPEIRALLGPLQDAGPPASPESETSLTMALAMSLERPKDLTGASREELIRLLYDFNLKVRQSSVPSRESTFLAVESVRELLSIGAQFERPGTSGANPEALHNWRLLQDAANRIELFSYDIARAKR